MNRDQTAFSDRERAVIEAIAAERGVTFEEAVSQLGKEALANRIRRKTGRAPAKVIEFRRKT